MAPQEARGLHVQDGYKVLILGNQSVVRTKAVVLTTRVSYRTLDAPGLKRLSGAGIYHGAARPEARSCSDRPVYIIGEANSAGQAAMFLARYAARVFILIRGGSLAASGPRSTQRESPGCSRGLIGHEFAFSSRYHGKGQAASCH